MDEANYISLRPQGSVGTDSGLPSRPTAQALFVGLLAILVAVAGIIWSNGKVATATNQKNGAEAVKQKLDLETQKIQAELKQLEGAGGVKRVETIRSVLNSRMDWKKVILGISNSAPAGLTISGFSASSGAGASPDTSTTTPTTPNQTAGGLTVPLTGTAPSSGDLQDFIRSLRKKRSIVANVQLDKASDAEGKVSYSLTVQLVPPARTTGTSSSQSSTSSDGTAEGAAAEAVQNTPQGALVK